MKTLEQLDLTNYKTGNYADYLKKNNETIICCGLMDIHEDSGNLGINNDPIFKIEPLYWNDDVVFVHQPRTRWHSLSKEDFLKKKKKPGITFFDAGFSFNATKYHGLVPKNIAEHLNSENYLQSKEYLYFARSCGEKMTPKLVWKFI